MVALKVWSALGATIASPVVWFMCNSVPFRTERVKALLKRPIIEQGYPTNGTTFFLETALGSDMKACILSNSGGVKLVWAPQGTGKTFTARHVVRELQAANQIRGAIFINPPDRSSKSIPSEWFRSALRDAFGNLLDPNEKLSEILPKFDGRRPYVIVIDNLDGANMDDDMRAFIKTLAEDSVFTRSYVVLAMCASPKNAKTVWDWNGHEKITLLSDFRAEAPTVYRWGEVEVERWIADFQLSNPSSPIQERDALRDLLKQLAVRVGTPGFLVECTSSPIVTTKLLNNEVLAKRVTFKSELWTIGKEILES